MKKRMLHTLVVFLTAGMVFSCSPSLFAKINFQGSVQEKIDLRNLEIDKDEFLLFVEEFIQTKEEGLGIYGRVSLKVCNIEVTGQKLIEYKDMEGNEIRFLTSPSCQQVVLRRILQNSYDYDTANLGSYDDRECIMAVEKIISPILEYYTLKYEEKPSGKCNACEFKIKDRLEKILSARDRIQKSCETESNKAMKFITDFDAFVEKTFKAKMEQKR